MFDSIRCYLLSILIISVPLFLNGCGDETTDEGTDNDGKKDGKGSGDSDTDTDTDTDSDTDTDTDTDSDSDSDSDKLTEAYLILNHAHIGQKNLTDACDMNGNGKANNAIAALLNLIPPNMLDEDPDVTLQSKIESGEYLMVVGLFDLDNFTDDTFNVKTYKGVLDDPGAGVPDDLFSGYGEITVELPEQSTIEGATIVDGEVTTPEGTMMGTVPLGGSMNEMEMFRATINARIEGKPDEDMLGGGTNEGKICGAIDAQELADIVKNSPDTPAALKPLIGGFINQVADLTCNGKNCLSIALKFTAVSVKRKN